MSVYIGVDPGASGAMAAVDRGGLPIGWVKLESTDAEIASWLRRMVEDEDAFALLEHVGAMPKQGRTSIFKFGASFGACRMALAACAVPFDLVAPGKWQASMRCRSGGDKNVTKRRAQELFPALKVTHATADALLLAECCRRQRLGIGGA